MLYSNYYSQSSWCATVKETHFQYLSVFFSGSEVSNVHYPHVDCWGILLRNVSTAGSSHLFFLIKTNRTEEQFPLDPCSASQFSGSLEDNIPYSQKLFFSSVFLLLLIFIQYHLLSGIKKVFSSKGIYFLIVAFEMSISFLIPGKTQVPNFQTSISPSRIFTCCRDHWFPLTEAT